MKRRDQPGTYFPVPKSVFLVDLAPSEIAIYAYLMSRENRETYECIVGYEEIATATGMSKKSVPRHIKKLLLRGLIEVERTKVLMKDGRIRNGKHKYRILPIEPIAAIYEERRFRKMLATMQVQRALDEYDAKNKKKGELQ